jgi:hypothetical protein
MNRRVSILRGVIERDNDMRLRQLLTAAAMLAGTIAGAAHAGEIWLYEEPGFGGGRLDLNGAASNFEGNGFNDRAQSLVVRSGRWQVCTDADFRGACMEVGPGQYGGLDGTFNRRISSAREVGFSGGPVARNDPGRPDNNYQGRTDQQRRGVIKFFSGTTFTGRSLDLQEDTPNFADRRYNDRASSIIVTEGVWELCTNASYSGSCRVYGPGRYADLGWGMDGQISSARVVRGAANGETPVVRGWERNRNEGTSRVIFFRGPGLHGPSVALNGTVSNMQDIGFNDSVASMVVEGGPWMVCSDADFRGQCRVFGPGRYDDLRGTGLARAVSSARPTFNERYGRR